MTSELELSAGRAAFGHDPAGYAAARPNYPDALYGRLVERAGLLPGAAVFEIGPGPGLATARLLDLGADPLLAVEPDRRLAAWLRRRFADRPLTVVESPLEQADLPHGRFDLGAAATSFHWLDQASGLARVRGALRPGGWWAMWWTHYGAERGRDPFQDASRALFAGAPRSPSHGRAQGPPFALDRAARLADLALAGLDQGEADTWTWEITFSTERLVDLYATFSPIHALPPARRRRLLDGLAEIAEREFGGVVKRTFTTALYTARRP